MTTTAAALCHPAAPAYRARPLAASRAGSRMTMKRLGSLFFELPVIRPAWRIAPKGVLGNAAWAGRARWSACPPRPGRRPWGNSTRPVSSRGGVARSTKLSATTSHAWAGLTSPRLIGPVLLGARGIEGGHAGRPEALAAGRRCGPPPSGTARDADPAGRPWSQVRLALRLVVARHPAPSTASHGRPARRGHVDDQGDVAVGQRGRECTGAEPREAGHDVRPRVEAMPRAVEIDRSAPRSGR